MTTLPATTDNEPDRYALRVLVPGALRSTSAKHARRAGWATEAMRAVRIPVLPAHRRKTLNRLLHQPGAWIHISDVAEQLRTRYQYGSPAYSVLTRIMAATRDMAALMAGAALDGAALATEPRERTA